MGLSVEEFWALTPRELKMTLDAAEKRAEAEHDRDAWIAWHTAALVRAKQMPTLAHLAGRDKAKPLKGKELAKRKAEHEEMVRRMGKRHGR